MIASSDTRSAATIIDVPERHPAGERRIFAVAVVGLVVSVGLLTSIAKNAYPVKVEQPQWCTAFDCVGIRAAARPHVDVGNVLIAATLHNRTKQVRCVEVRAVVRDSQTKDVQPEVNIDIGFDNKLGPQEVRPLQFELPGFTRKQLEEKVASATIYVAHQHACKA